MLRIEFSLTKDGKIRKCEKKSKEGRDSGLAFHPLEREI